MSHRSAGSVHLLRSKLRDCTEHLYPVISWLHPSVPMEGSAAPHLLNLTCESGRLWRPMEGSIWALEGRSDVGLTRIQVVAVRLILTVGLVGFWKISGIREPKLWKQCEGVSREAFLKKEDPL